MDKLGNSTRKALINDSQALVGAKTKYGYTIPTYDDSWGQLYVLRDSLGILGIVRAQTWEDAYGIAEDEFMPEADETVEELVKEYGFRREHKKVVKDTSVTTSSEHLSAGERFEIFPDDYPNGRLAPTFIRWQTIETPDADAWSENELFQEAYGFRPNGPNATDKRGHGIYAKDINGEYLDALTPKLLDELEIVIEIADEEGADNDK